MPITCSSHFQKDTTDNPKTMNKIPGERKFHKILTLENLNPLHLKPNKEVMPRNSNLNSEENPETKREKQNQREVEDDDDDDDGDY